MIHQYHAQRFRRMGDRQIGTIPVGTVLYIQHEVRPFSFPRYTTRRNPWIVEAWLNRDYFPCVKGRPSVLKMAGGHTAIVRSLRDGRRKEVADWLLLACLDAGMEKLLGRWPSVFADGQKMRLAHRKGEA